MLAYFV